MEFLSNIFVPPSAPVKKISSAVTVPDAPVSKGISDPKVFGPGIWYVLHCYARDAKTQNKKQDFVAFINQAINTLPCMKCREHAGAYLKKHPIENYWSIKDPKGEDIGFFKWTWLFHNSVNERLGKPVIDWETAKSMYYNASEVCTSDCDEGESAPEAKSVTPKKASSSYNAKATPSGFRYTAARR